MNAFYEHHQDSIRFGYRCFDRLLLNGLIQPFQQPSDRILQHLSPAVSGEPRRFARNCQPVPELGRQPFAKVGRTDSRSTRRPPRQVSGRAVQLLHQRRALGTHVCTHDRHREAEGESLAFADGAALGGAVQLLHQRRALGTHVCTHVPLPAILGPRLPQSTSLAGSAHARRGHRFSAMHQCVPAVLPSGSLTGTGRFADGARLIDLRSEVAGHIYPIFHRKGTQGSGLPASLVLHPGRTLRQPHLPPPRWTGSENGCWTPIGPLASPTRSPSSSAGRSPNNTGESYRPSSRTCICPTP